MRINMSISKSEQGEDVIPNKLLTGSSLRWPDDLAEASAGGSMEGSTVVDVVDSVKVEPASDRRSVACVSGNYTTISYHINGFYS